MNPRLSVCWAPGNVPEATTGCFTSGSQGAETPTGEGYLRQPAPFKALSLSEWQCFIFSSLPGISSVASNSEMGFWIFARSVSGTDPRWPHSLSRLYTTEQMIFSTWPSDSICSAVSNEQAETCCTQLLAINCTKLNLLTTVFTISYSWTHLNWHTHTAHTRFWIINNIKFQWLASPSVRQRC